MSISTFKAASHSNTTTDSLGQRMLAKIYNSPPEVQALIHQAAQVWSINGRPFDVTKGGRTTIGNMKDRERILSELNLMYGFDEQSGWTPLAVTVFKQLGFKQPRWWQKLIMEDLPLMFFVGTCVFFAMVFVIIVGVYIFK
jgi:hypothetical protein